MSWEEYRRWRGEGVAFAWREGECTRPNRSLAVGVYRGPGGVWRHCDRLGGEIASGGPLVAFGLNAPPGQEHLLGLEHGRPRYPSAVLTELRLRWALQLIGQRTAPLEVFACSGRRLGPRGRLPGAHVCWLSLGALSAVRPAALRAALAHHAPGPTLLLFEGPRYLPAFTCCLGEQHAAQVRAFTEELGAAASVASLDPANLDFATILYRPAAVAAADDDPRLL